MFTGLIADVGVITSLARDDAGAVYRIRTDLADRIEPGASVAVNGVCLTATATTPGAFAVQVMNETLTRCGELAQGAHVNLELALRASDRLGGHIVQGHVDGTGTVRDLRRDGFSRVVTIAAPATITRYLVEKGSVAVQGVSLTVSALLDGGFEVSLIPETLVHTNLAELSVGDIVNLEADLIAKHVERLLAARTS